MGGEKQKQNRGDALSSITVPVIAGNEGRSDVAPRSNTRRLLPQFSVTLLTPSHPPVHRHLNSPVVVVMYRHDLLKLRRKLHPASTRTFGIVDRLTET